MSPKKITTGDVTKRTPAPPSKTDKKNSETRIDEPTTR
jgi:hypothetical protein